MGRELGIVKRFWVQGKESSRGSKAAMGIRALTDCSHFNIPCTSYICMYDIVPEEIG